MKRRLFITVGVLIFALCACSQAAESISGAIVAPGVIYLDEDLQGKVTIKNDGAKEYNGALYVEVDQPRATSTLLAHPWVLTPGKDMMLDFHIPVFKNLQPGDRTVKIVFKDEADNAIPLATHALTVLPQRTPHADENLLPNSSFEGAFVYSGMYLHKHDWEHQRWEYNGEFFWRPWDRNNWWVEGNSTEGIQTVPDAHTGSNAIRIDATTPRTISSGLDIYAAKGTYTLSAYVKTQDAKGVLILDFTKDMNQAKTRQSVARTTVPLPANAKDWVRVSVTGVCPDMLCPVARVQVDAGEVIVDDVQLELGDKATPYNVRPDEYLRITFNDVDEKELATFVKTDTAPKKIRLHNDSRTPLKGKVFLRYGPWNQPEVFEVAEFDAGEIPPGSSKTFEILTHPLRVDGYIISARLQDGGVVVADGLWNYNDKVDLWFALSTMLYSRNVSAFTVVPKQNPRAFIGIGNCVQRRGGAQQPKSSLERCVDIRNIGMKSYRSGCGAFHMFDAAVAGGIALYTFANYEDTSDPDVPRNPVISQCADFYTEKGRECVRDNGIRDGKKFAANPLVVGIQMSNETYWAMQGFVCPTAAGDENFRQWCKKKHGTLTKLNARWKTNYTDWSQVNQVISEPFYHGLLVKMNEGKLNDGNRDIGKLSVSVDSQWKKDLNRPSFPRYHWENGWPKEALDELNKTPGKTMDWLRWRTDTGLDSFKTYIDAAHTVDKKTLYGNDLPISIWHKQFVIPFVRDVADACFINIRYTSGYPNSFGTPAECMSDLEMNESTASAAGKVLYTIETYHQPTWPAESAALQSWGLVAHGATNVLFFSWYPMSDRGTPSKRLEYSERSKDEGGDPFMRAAWYMVDVDGSHLKPFDSYARSVAEVTKFDEDYDAITIRRHPTDIAIYSSNDTGEDAVYQTAHTPWGAESLRTNCIINHLLRMQGISSDYVDDATLPNTPGQFRKIIVPYSPVLSQETAGKLKSFAQQGGTVILLGPAGLRDPWQNVYKNIGGPAWVDLKWQAPKYGTELGLYVFDKRLSVETGKSETRPDKPDTRTPAHLEVKNFRGMNLGSMENAKEIHDVVGNVVGFSRPWGKGTLIAYGIFPDGWSSSPHTPRNWNAWIQEIIQLGELEYTGRWITTSAANPAGTDLGTGPPAVDLVVRIRGEDEKYIFALNQGGSGEGLIEIPVPPGNWKAEDAIHSERPISGIVNNGIWQTKMPIDPLGYRVIRLKRMKKNRN